MAKIVVSEAGASVYSASAFASQELPELDVTLRGAVSIARRLQDPLAELVKIDPKSIGVGPIPARSRRKQAGALARRGGRGLRQRGRRRRQHRLGAAAGAGLGDRQRARAEHRRSTATPTARSRSRKALKEVPRLGPKAFEQCAGFLRISGGDDPLDASGVHPEAYPVVRQDPRRDQERHQGADRQRRVAARAQAAELRRRHIRPADRDRHPAGIGKARPRSAPGVQGRGVQGGRRDAEGSQARHDPRRRGHQRRRVRRLRRYRRASGRAGAHLGDVARPSSRIRARWSSPATSSRSRCWRSRSPRKRIALGAASRRRTGRQGRAPGQGPSGAAIPAAPARRRRASRSRRPAAARSPKPCAAPARRPPARPGDSACALKHPQDLPAALMRARAGGQVQRVVPAERRDPYAEDPRFGTAAEALFSFGARRSPCSQPGARFVAYRAHSMKGMVKTSRDTRAFLVQPATWVTLLTEDMGNTFLVLFRC